MEHCLLLANSFHLSNLERTQCNINVSYLESIYKWERPHLYKVLPYHVWLLPLLEVILSSGSAWRGLTYGLLAVGQ